MPCLRLSEQSMHIIKPNMPLIITTGLHNDYTFHTGFQTQHYNINFGLRVNKYTIK